MAGSRDVLKTLNTATGELMDGLSVYIPPKQRNGFQGWLAMNQEALKDLARAVVDGRLHGRDRAVLDMLAANVGYENTIAVPQAVLAAELGMDRGNFNRSMKRLLEFGAIDKGGKIGRVNCYRLSPAYGWRGSAKNHRAAMSNKLAKSIESSSERKFEAIQGGRSCE